MPPLGNGCGIGLGLGDISRTTTPGQLAAALQSVNGANLVWLGCSEDATYDESDNATGLVARIGSNASAASPYLSVLTTNQRRPLYTTDDAFVARRLLFAAPAFKHATIVCAGPSVNFDKYRVAFRGANAVFLGSNGSKTWYTADGWSHKKDGATSESIDSATRVYDAMHASGLSSQNCMIGGPIAEYSSFNACWMNNIYFIALFTESPDLASQSANIAILKAHFGLI